MLTTTADEAPRTILHYPAEGERFAGAVDYLAVDAGLRGWVVEMAAPGRPVTLLAVADGIVLTRPVHAMMDRPDIDAVLGRRTQCGFLIGWSRFDPAAVAEVERRAPDATVHVVIAETGAAVPMTFGELSLGTLARHLAQAPEGDRKPAFAEATDYHLLLDTGLFDEAWYRDRYGAAIPQGMPPLLDYVRTGEAAGRQPNLFFDPGRHASRRGRPGSSGALLDYSLTGGDPDGPDGPFDEAWYRATHDVPAGRTALADYLAHRAERAPSPWFDPDYYREASGAANDAGRQRAADDAGRQWAADDAGRQWAADDPYRHFAEVGVLEGLFPSATIADADGDLPPEAELYMEKRREEAAERRRRQADAPSLTAAEPPGPPAAEPPGPKAAEPPSAHAAEPPISQAAEPPISQVAEPPISQAAEPPRLQPAAPLADVRTGGGGLGEDGAGLAVLTVPPERRAGLLAEAERVVAAGGEGRADAALTLAVGRAAAGDAAGAGEAAALLLDAAGGADGELARRILSEAHVLYESGRRREAEEIYRRAFERGNRDYLVALRLLEGAVERRDAAAGATYAALFGDRFEIATNPWAAVTLARFALLRGVPEEAVHLLVALPPLGAADPVAEAAVLNTLIDTGALDTAAARAAATAGAAAEILFAAHARIAVAVADAPRIEALLADPRTARLPNWQLGEMMFRLSAPGRMPLGVQHRLMEATDALLATRGLDHNPVVQARLHFLLQMKRWSELGALFEALEDHPLGSHRETLLRKLEYFCEADETEAAEAIYRDHFADAELSKWESLAVLRFLGEAKRWAEAGEVLIRHVARGHDFVGAGHVAMRIVRKARLHEAVLEAAAAPSSRRERRLDEFIRLVDEDLTILSRAVALSPKPSRAAALRPSYRSNWILGGEGAVEETEDVAVFLCTNQRYFLSALTLLTSFFGQAPQLESRLFVFLDKDVPRRWQGTIAMVAARFGRVVEVVQEEEFVPPEPQHRTEYGFFSGGGGLARAAYFRLYAAKYLLGRYSLRRAVYLDTDIVCRGDISGMLDLDFGEAVIAAAREDHTPEVVRAAAHHGLDPFSYFNSGVLVLRMDDPRLREGIERAIAVAENEPQRLIFHDQCALNIAFRGEILPLPPRYNFFLRPSRERNGYIEDGILLHFVDRPKPWDVVFDRTYREEWRVWALMLGTLVPQGLYIDVFSAANRD
jgi:lipopolysaccharide biosynthesis glycosyltransferase